MPWAFRPREEVLSMNETLELTRTKEFIRKKIPGEGVFLCQEF